MPRTTRRTLIAANSSGPIYRWQTRLATAPPKMAYSLLADFGERGTDPSADVESTAARHYSGPSALLQNAAMTGITMTSLAKTTATDRLSAFRQLIEFIRRTDDATGLESLYLTELQAMWSWLPRQDLDATLALWDEVVRHGRIATTLGVAVRDPLSGATYLLPAVKLRETRAISVSTDPWSLGGYGQAGVIDTPYGGLGGRRGYGPVGQGGYGPGGQGGYGPGGYGPGTQGGYGPGGQGGYGPSGELGGQGGYGPSGELGGGYGLGGELGGQGGYGLGGGELGSGGSLGGLGALSGYSPNGPLGALGNDIASRGDWGWGDTFKVAGKGLQIYGTTMAAVGLGERAPALLGVGLGIAYAGVILEVKGDQLIRDTPAGTGTASATAVVTTPVVVIDDSDDTEPSSEPDSSTEPDDSGGSPEDYPNPFENVGREALYFPGADDLYPNPEGTGGGGPIGPQSGGIRDTQVTIVGGRGLAALQHFTPQGTIQIYG